MIMAWMELRMGTGSRNVAIKAERNEGRMDPVEVKWEGLEV
jgi:hypothetical protein